MDVRGWTFRYLLPSPPEGDAPVRTSVCPIRFAAPRWRRLLHLYSVPVRARPSTFTRVASEWGTGTGDALRCFWRHLPSTVLVDPAQQDLEHSDRFFIQASSN
jgi:hypothetical protein